VRRKQGPGRYGERALLIRGLRGSGNAEEENLKVGGEIAYCTKLPQIQGGGALQGPIPTKGVQFTRKKVCQMPQAGNRRKGGKRGARRTGGKKKHTSRNRNIVTSVGGSTLLVGRKEVGLACW